MLSGSPFTNIHLLLIWTGTLSLLNNQVPWAYFFPVVCSKDPFTSAFLLLCACRLDTYISLFVHLGLRTCCWLYSHWWWNKLWRLKKFAADCTMQPNKADKAIPEIAYMVLISPKFLYGLLALFFY